MLSAPKRREIDHRTIKLIVGVGAISLAALTSYFATSTLTSISASYYEGGWSQSIFIGFLFAISALMLAYNGLSVVEMYLSRLASVSGFGVALFPCKCETHIELVPHVHGFAAATMFLVLAYFSYRFLRRAWNKGHTEAKLRAGIYGACCLAILGSILVLVADHLFGGTMSARVPRLTFYGEATALVAFGISWLTASRILPIVTRQQERFSPFRGQNPD